MNTKTETKGTNAIMDMKDFVLTNQDIEDVSASITKAIKNKAAAVYALNADLGTVYIFEVLEAATIGANLMYDLMLGKVEKAVVKAQAAQEKPKESKKEKTIYGADDIYNYFFDKSIGKDTMTIDEIAKMLEELSNMGLI